MKSLVLILTLSFLAQSNVRSFDDVKSFTRGWLIGVFNEDVAGEVTECLDLQTLEGNIQNAINDFRLKTAEGIKNGVIELFEFFVALSPAIDKCLSDHADVMAMMKAKTSAIIELIENPDGLWKIILKNTVTHGIPIFQDIDNGIKAIKAKNWEEVGKDFGDAVDLSLFGDSKLKSTEEVTLFLEGFLDGFFDTDIAGNVVACLDDIQSLQVYVEQAIQDFEKKTAEGVKDGIIDLFQLFKVLPNAITICLKDNKDLAVSMVKKVELTLSYITDPALLAEKVAKNLLFHGITIFEDIDHGVKAIKDNNWEEAGKDFGQAIDLSLFGESKLKSIDDLESFLRGFLIGFYGTDVVGNVVACVEDIQTLSSDVEQAIQDFKRKTEEGIKDGIIDLLKVFKVLPDAIMVCLKDNYDVAVSSVKKVELTLSYIADPAVLAEKVAENVLLHGITIFKDIDDGVKAIVNKNWEEAGKDFGEVVTLSLYGFQVEFPDLPDIPVEQIKEFERGFIIGIFQEDVAGEVVECLNVEIVYQHLKQAFDDFKQLNLDGIEKGMAEIFLVMKLLPASIDQCLVEHQDVIQKMNAKIAAREELFSDKSKLIQVLKTNLRSNFFTILKELADLGQQFVLKDYQAAGKDLGEVVDLLLFGKELINEKMEEIIALEKGFLIGVFKQDVAGNVVECTEVEEVFYHLRRAIQDFKKLNAEWFVKGMTEIDAMNQLFLAGIDGCLSDHLDVAQDMKQRIGSMSALIQDQSKLLKTLKTNFRKNIFLIIKILADEAESILKKDFLQAGIDVGTVVDLLLFGKQLNDDKIDEMKAFERGFIIGVFKQDVAGNVVECLDVEEVFQHLMTAIGDFQQLNINGFEKGMAEIFAVIQLIPAGIDQCLSDHQDVAQEMKQRIATMSALIQDQGKLLKTLKTNFRSNIFTIIKLLASAGEGIVMKDFQKAGVAFGNVVDLLLFGKKSQLTISEDNLKDYVKGWLIGVFKHDVAGDVEECLDFQEVSQHLMSAVSDFKSHTLQGFKDGALEILAIFGMLPPGIDQCLSEHQDVAEQMKAQIAQVIQLAQDTDQLVAVIKGNLKEHKFTIMWDLAKNLAGIIRGDWEAAGESFGDAVNLLLLGGSRNVVEMKLRGQGLYL